MRTFSAAFIMLSISAQAQVYTEVLEPAANVGTANCTWANWAQTPDLIFPWNQVTDTAMVVNDGTAADSLGCDSVAGLADLTGRIAVAYRGACNFSLKAKLAEEAGAVALVIINNMPGAPIEMGTGSFGDLVTIPVVLVPDSFGTAMHDALLNETTILRLGSTCYTSTDCDDVIAHVTGFAFQSGFEGAYWITVQNVSPYIPRTDLVVDLTYDPLLTFASSDEAPTVNEPGHISWTIPVLDIISTEQIYVHVTVPADTALVGTMLNATLTTAFAPTDGNTSNNTYTTLDSIVSAYDPNDKRALTSSRLSNTAYYLGADQYVDYTINFQNTGNAPAQTVVLVDTLAPLFLPAVPEILGASHLFTVDLVGTNVLKFTFPNIQLPDSTTNEPASHGFASFRLRPASSLTYGNVLANAADIYFDFNPPVRTNTSELVVATPQGIPAVVDEGLQILPNPATDLITLQLPANNAFHQLVVRSITGAEVMRTTWSTGIRSRNIDVSMLPPGVYLLDLTGKGMRNVLRFVKERP
jgi:hypothetical protein